MEFTGRFLQLFLMAYGHFETGALYSIVGTTLPELQCTFHEDLTVVSGLFISLGLATGCASVLSVVLIRKCNIYLLMAIMMLFYCGGVAMVAVTSFIEVAFVAIFVAGFAVGVVLNVTSFMCNLMFPEKAFALHALGSGFSAGSVLSPVIAEPFLGRTEVSSQATMSLMNMSLIPQRERMLAVNELTIFNSSSPYNILLDNQTCGNSSSTVSYMYITKGLLALPLCLGFFICFLKNDPDVMYSVNPNDAYTELKTKLSKCEYVFIGLLIMSFPLPYGLPYSYGSYLTTVTTEGSRNIGIHRAALLTSLFWLLFFLGRLTSTAGSFCMRQIVILYICCFGGLLSVSILVVKEESEVFLWIGSLSLAFFSGPVLATVITWCREFITLTPPILGAALLIDCVGATLLSYISGQVISRYGGKSLYYYCLGLSLLQLGTFCSLHCLGMITKHNSRLIQKQMNEMEVNR